MMDEQEKAAGIAIHCMKGILAGVETVTVTREGKHRLKGFPRGELLSVGSDGSHNYAVCPVKLMAWLHGLAKAERKSGGEK